MHDRYNFNHHSMTECTHITVYPHSRNFVNETSVGTEVECLLRMGAQDK
jgi:hypothetical protein